VKLFNFEQIRDNADGREVAVSMLGMTPKRKGGEYWSFDCPWRPGSDSGAFSVGPKGYRDFADGDESKNSGSVLDMVANARHGGDIMPAQEELGEFLHLTPCTEAKSKRQFVCAYDYVDADGKVVHQTVRYANPKDFLQRRPDPAKPGEYIWSISGITPVLYRLPELMTAKVICVVGGEKDADTLASIGLPATTNPMGEGNWKDHYNQHFAGKHVVIIPDLDETGRLHAKTITFGVKDIAASIRVVNLPFPPDASPAKDSTDWVKYWRDKGKSDADILAELKDIIKKTAQEDPKVIVAPKETQKEITEAKKANRTPFQNYDYLDSVDDKGKEKRIKVPRHVNAMMDELHTRFWNFPRRVGSVLFDHDRKNGTIRTLDHPDKLFAWMHEKSGHCVVWSSTIEGAMSQPQFHNSVYNNSIRYEIISGVPNWPPRDDAYYTHDTLPQATPDAKYLNEFVNFFYPDTELDWHLLKVLIASPLYYKPCIQRPMWVIDTDDGRGTGKSRMADLIAMLYSSDSSGLGGALLVDASQLSNEMTMSTIYKRLLSEEGRQKRILILDNVEGFFRSASLATLITSPQISGMRPYGRGEETRPNDLTYVITSNQCTLSKDLADRSFMIKIKRPTGNFKEWESKVLAFIKNHRLNVMADIIAILEKGANYEVQPMSRFKQWENDVMAPILGTLEVHSDVSKNNHERKNTADGDVARMDVVQDHIAARLAVHGIDPDKDVAFIHSRVAFTWAREADPDIGGRTEKGISVVLKELFAPHMNGKMSTDKGGETKYKMKRGYWWNRDLFSSMIPGMEKVKIMTMDVEGLIKMV